MRNKYLGSFIGMSLVLATMGCSRDNKVKNLQTTPLPIATATPTPLPEHKGAFEKSGEKIDRGLEKTRETMNRGLEKTGEKIENAGHKIKETFD